MSSKSTLLLLPCCHIFNDCIGSNGGDTLVIDVSYSAVRDLTDDNDYIEVEQESEFANLMQYLLKGKTEDELLKASKGDL
ncbi:MAG TPA: hypothetical protein EYN54_14350 [Methylococcaceae bacterium]|nr:hypothetical protein [Methylococcaceae bacterium]